MHAKKISCFYWTSLQNLKCVHSIKEDITDSFGSIRYLTPCICLHEIGTKITHHFSWHHGVFMLFWRNHCIIWENFLISRWTPFHRHVLQLAGSGLHWLAEKKAMQDSSRIILLLPDPRGARLWIFWYCDAVSIFPCACDDSRTK